MNVYFDGGNYLKWQLLYSELILTASLPGIDHTYSLGLQFSQDCVPDPFNGMQYEQCSTHSPVILPNPSVECFTFETFTYTEYGINKTHQRFHGNGLDLMVIF